ncbi:MAG TPA: hypothetical protein VGD65_24865 [Chryseosolibacter sp.]
MSGIVSRFGDDALEFKYQAPFIRATFSNDMTLMLSVIFPASTMLTASANGSFQTFRLASVSSKTCPASSPVSGTMRCGYCLVPNESCLIDGPASSPVSGTMR